MAAPVLPREECIRRARAVLDAALDRIARDRAMGRLDPATAAYLDRIAPRASAPARAA